MDNVKYKYRKNQSFWCWFFYDFFWFFYDFFNFAPSFL